MSLYNKNKISHENIACSHTNVLQYKKRKLETNMLEKLDEILLSHDVVKNFHNAYKDHDFKEWLLGILPEIEKCKLQGQDNPWHIYNCLDHILHSIEEINKQSIHLDEKTRRMLAYIMLLHDIGKPESHIRRYSKKYGREVDSFFGHNIASMKIAGRVLPDLNFSPAQTNIMKKLIEDHDMFMFITLEPDGNEFHHVLSPALVQEHIHKLNEYGDGRQLLHYLTMIGLADNMAQNPALTEQSIKTVKTMQNMINYNKQKEM